MIARLNEWRNTVGMFSKKKQPDAFRLTIPKGISPENIKEMRAEYTTDNPLEYDTADILGIAMISMMVDQPKIFQAYIEATVKAAFGEDAYEAAQAELEQEELKQEATSRLNSDKTIH